MEDKWTFLRVGKDLDVPVSPFIEDVETLVCKNKNIEGGMGIFFYDNAVHGGEWILQERLKNSMWLNELLPNNAPLSTMRVITTSTWSMSEEASVQRVQSLLSLGETDPDQDVSGATCLSSYDCGDSSSPVSKAHKNLLASKGSPSSIAAKHAGTLSTPPGGENQGGEPVTSTTSATVSSEVAQGENGVSRDSSNASTPVQELETPTSSKLRQNSESFDSVTLSSTPANTRNTLGSTMDSGAFATAHKYIEAASAVLRLGRANSNTDHSSVLFDVDIKTGVVRPGTTNAHWYQLGWKKALACPWLPQYDNISVHPDAPCPQVAGKLVPNMQEALEIVIQSHFKMMPDVPIVGWDVAFTSKGIFLLEVNLSCNFFKGKFDVPRYIDLVDRYWTHLEKIEKLKGSSRELSARKYRRSSEKEH